MLKDAGKRTINFRGVYKGKEIFPATHIYGNVLGTNMSRTDERKNSPFMWVIQRSLTDHSDTLGGVILRCMPSGVVGSGLDETLSVMKDVRTGNLRLGTASCQAGDVGPDGTLSSSGAPINWFGHIENEMAGCLRQGICP